MGSINTWQINPINIRNMGRDPVAGNNRIRVNYLVSDKYGLSLKPAGLLP